MKTLILALGLMFASLPSASGWAILLKTPSFRYPAQAHESGKEAIGKIEEAMVSLDFLGGVIHVGAPTPSRSLRFGAPGQDLESLLPMLVDLGFTVRLSFSSSMHPQTGFVIIQQEAESGELAIQVNSGHPEFELEALTILLGR